MKKSLVTLIIFVLLLVNTVVTVLMFTKLNAEVTGANELITKVCEAIELDVASSGSNESAVPADQTEEYNVIDSENKMTYNLKMDEDGEAHFAVLTCTLSVNMSSKAYETYGGTNLDTYKARMQGKIQDIISDTTYKELMTDQKSVKTRIKDELNSLFGASDFIIGVNFPQINSQ